VSDHISVESKPQACVENQAEWIETIQRGVLPGMSGFVTLEPLNLGQELATEI
jgi:hypothetical protein